LTPLITKSIINGVNEQRLFDLASEIISEEISERKKSFQEICAAVAPTPSKGIFWKNGCEIIRTWR